MTTALLKKVNEAKSYILENGVQDIEVGLILGSGLGS